MTASGRCASSRACSAGCSLPCSSPRTRPAVSSSLVSTARSPTFRHSRRISRRCAEPNGSSTPSARSAGPRRCSPICRATPTVSPFANRRLIAFDDAGVTFKWKDYRAKGRERAKVMTLATGEFIRRFLIHVLPSGFHRIRHYGLFAGGVRTDTIARARELLNVAVPQYQADDADARNSAEPQTLSHPCPCCGGRMIIIETFERGCSPRTRPAAVIKIDTS